MVEKYKDRAAVAAVIEDLGLFPAWEARKLTPNLMPDRELEQLALSIEEAFAFAIAFVNMFRAKLGLSAEVNYIKNITGNDYDKDVNQ